MSMKNYNDTIWNRTSDFPICSTAPVCVWVCGVCVCVSVSVSVFMCVWYVCVVCVWCVCECVCVVFVCV